jgi:Tfp pilus assembly protein PilF
MNRLILALLVALIFSAAHAELPTWEEAIAIEPNCCGESAYVLLALIYQVPLTGKDQSETVKQYFAKAFAVDPNNAVTNTRYAGYLMRSGDYENALKHANAALTAPPLINRPTEDRAVREQAQQFIEQIKERQKK